MLGAHTRLKCSPEVSVILDRSMTTFGDALHWAYGAFQKSDLPSLRQTLKSRFHLSSMWQAGVVARVEQLNNEAVGRKDWLLTSQALKIESLTETIAQLGRQIESGKSKLIKLSKPGMAKSFSKPGQKKACKENLERLKFKRFQKNRKLLALQHQHAELTSSDIHAHRVFGSRKLLAQRHRVGEESSPFPSEESWRQEWDRRRHGEVWFVGTGNQTRGNQAAQVDVKAKTFTLKLPNDQARERLNAEAERLGLPVERVPNKLSFKRLVLENVTFSPKHAEQIARAQ